MSDQNFPDATSNDPYGQSGSTGSTGSTPYGASQPAGSVPPPPPYQGQGDAGYGQVPPAPGYGQPMGAPPKNYLVWAILSTIFCCWPLGIPAIVFAARVNGKWMQGDHAGAIDASNKAKKFALWATIAGIVVAIGYGILAALGTFSDAATPSVTPTAFGLTTFGI